MQTDKKNAISYDSPISLAKAPYLLLQERGTTFFHSDQRIYHPLPSIKHKPVHFNYRFGLSQDSPFHTKYSITNELTQQRPMKKLFIRMLGSSTEREHLIKDSFNKSNMTGLWSNIKSMEHTNYGVKLLELKRGRSLGNIYKIPSNVTLREYSRKATMTPSKKSFRVHLTNSSKDVDIVIKRIFPNKNKQL